MESPNSLTDKRLQKSFARSNYHVNVTKTLLFVQRKASNCQLNLISLNKTTFRPNKTIIKTFKTLIIKRSLHIIFK